MLCGCAGASAAGLRSVPARVPARSPRASTPTPFTSTTGGFKTVIPAGFRSVLELPKIKKTGDLYFAVGRRVHGFTINMNVLRARVGSLGAIGKATRTELGAIQRTDATARIGKVRRARIAHGPARVVDYISGPKGKQLAHRQIYFEHRGWLYVISYGALPSTFSLGVKGLTQMVNAWRWT